MARRVGTSRSKPQSVPLREWWQDYEAGIQEGLEDAADHPEKPVPSHNGQERREDPSLGRGRA